MEGTTSFLDYLDEHYRDYDFFIALSRPYVASKAGYAVYKIFGIRGIVIPLKGDVCKSSKNM
jgi:hypothetical protein